MRCHRLDEEDWLETVASGSPHSDHCPDCRRAMAAYDRIAAALSQDSDREVPSDWMERMQARLALSSQPAEPRATGSSPSLVRPSPEVMAGLATRSDTPPRRRWAGWLMGSSGLTAAAAMALAIAGRPSAAFLIPSIEKAAVLYRAASDVPHSGDTLHLRAGPGDAEHFSLRIYRDSERLVMECSGPVAPCTEGEDGVEVAYLLADPGVYEVYLLTSDSTIAPPLGSLEEDLDAAFRGGARITSKRRLHAD